MLDRAMDGFQRSGGAGQEGILRVEVFVGRLCFEDAISAERRQKLSQAETFCGKAERIFNQALEGSKRWLGATQEKTFEALSGLGHVRLLRGNLARKRAEPQNSTRQLEKFQEAAAEFEKAKEVVHQVLDVAKQLAPANLISATHAFGLLGALYFLRGRLRVVEQKYDQANTSYHKAEIIFKQVIETREHLFGEAILQTLDALRWLGRLYYSSAGLALLDSQGQQQAETQYRRAEHMYVESIERCEKKHGKEHPFAVETDSNLVMVHRRLGELFQSQRRIEADDEFGKVAAFEKHLEETTGEKVDWEYVFGRQLEGSD